MINRIENKRVERGMQFVDALKSNNGSLNASSLRVHTKESGRITVTDPSREPRKQKREGQFFVSMPDYVARLLPDSVLDPETYVKALGITNDADAKRISADLISDKIGRENEPVFAFQNDNLELTVFNGSTTEHALALSAHTDRNLRDPVVRADYQQHAKAIVEPCIAKKSDYSLRIIEDCIASGDTIAGVLALLSQISHRSLDQESTIRIDVVVASTQGLLVLQKFAEENHVKLEINVGHLAYGLSSGSKVADSQAKAHAMYMEYPEEIFGKDVPYRNVVGDMGDAFVSLKDDDDFSTNRFRNDPHGPRKSDKKIIGPSDPYRRPAILYFANGGYWMRACKQDIYERLGIDQQNDNEIELSAKRIWAMEEEFGYGVLVDGLLVTT